MAENCTDPVTLGLLAGNNTVMNDLIASHLTQLRAEGKSPATILASRYWLNNADRRLPHGIDDVYPDEIAAYMATPHWSPNTRATGWRHLVRFYRWASAGDDPWLNGNPMDGLQRPRDRRGLPNPVTDEQLQHAYDNSNDWWKLVITLAAYCGLRRGEIAALERGDVDPERIRIEHGKGDKGRLVETHSDVWELVEPLPAGRLVLSPVKHRPVTAHLLGMMARHHFDRLDLPNVHLHMLRHYYATKLVQLGWDISIVRVLMGHASLVETQRYVFITGGQRRLAVNSLPSLAGGSSKSPSAGQGDMIPTHQLPADMPTCKQPMEMAR